MNNDVKTVLVVDDDPDAREYLTTVLQDHGIATSVAKDGVEAIAAIEKEKPALVALDITMPEKSGVAVYRRLKEDEDLKDVPVVIITGVSEDFKQFISRRRQVPPPEGYIAKPVDAAEFMKIVQQLLA